MNGRVEIMVPIYTWVLVILHEVVNICLFIFGIKLIGKSAFFVLAIYIILMIFDKNMYIYSASKLNLENNILELKLPFRNYKTIQLIDINSIEKNGNSHRGGEYFCIKYVGGEFNTHYLSYRNRSCVAMFIGELQLRIDVAKKELE